MSFRKIALEKVIEQIKNGFKCDKMRLRIKLEGRNLFLPFIFYFSYALKRGLYKNGKLFFCKKIKAYL